VLRGTSSLSTWIPAPVWMHGRATSWKTRRGGSGSSRWIAVLKVLCGITIQKKHLYSCI